ncbi:MULTISPECIES: ATP-binding protein [Paenibacillus]|uniref:Broad-specificity NMP kinase n=1 Tax=Paenibacillus tundrae TaxID=528187 RepID=A0ABT9WB77_9BACL|nr:MULTISPECIES: ATP-binding protein [Paenibacillus]MCG7380816.1 ATP-binding protein [Paenibacillus sp. ACRSA]MDQ0170512.1 broad-specificity NMP kinase [Paenibacillus tundrae]
MNIDFIILHGSPGNGKTTLSQRLHEHFRTPYFEFGWIPEFRALAPSVQITQKEEEQLAFENLMLVVKNYNRHGFKHIIITDLNDIRMLDIPKEFEGYNYTILTLCSDQDEVIKYRILNRDNGNSYTDWETSIKMNSLIRGRNKLPNEYRIVNSSSDVETTFQEILKVLEKHVPSRTNKIDVREDDFYSYITT